MKLFPKLGSKTITIIGGDGKKWIVPKLGVKHIDTYREILESAMSDSTDPQERLNALLTAKDRLFDLAAEVMPETIVKGDLLRFGYDELSELVAYLIYGCDDPEDVQTEPDTEKKTMTATEGN